MPASEYPVAALGPIVPWVYSTLPNMKRRGFKAGVLIGSVSPKALVYEVLRGC